MDEEITKALIHFQQEMTIFYSMAMREKNPKKLRIRWTRLSEASSKVMFLRERQLDLFIQGK